MLCIEWRLLSWRIKGDLHFENQSNCKRLLKKDMSLFIVFKFNTSQKKLVIWQIFFYKSEHQIKQSQKEAIKLCKSNEYAYSSLLLILVIVLSGVCFCKKKKDFMMKQRSYP